MAWFNRAQHVRETADALTAISSREVCPAPRINGIAGMVPTWTEFQSMRALWAMQVPAFNRGVRLISGTVAQLPLTQWMDGEPVQEPLLVQPEVDAPRWVTMQRTVRDLVLNGRAYWQYQTAPDGSGRDYFSQIDFDRVSIRPDRRHATIDGAGDEFPISKGGAKAVDNSLIEFEAFRDGALHTGLEVLTTALAQITSAGNMAASPSPTQILKNTSNYELSDTEIADLLAAYTSARSASTVAYLNGGVDLTTFGYNAQDLQLTELINQSAIQIARLLNLDPYWVGAGVPNSSMTYQSRLDMRQDLVDLTLADYIVPIEQRLSMPDLPFGVVRFDTSEFLRSNLDARARMAIDLFSAGVIDQDEARAFVSDKPTGGPT